MTQAITEKDVDAALLGIRKQVEDIERQAATNSELRNLLHSCQLSLQLVWEHWQWFGEEKTVNVQRAK